MKIDIIKFCESCLKESPSGFALNLFARKMNTRFSMSNDNFQKLTKRFVVARGLFGKSVDWWIVPKKGG